MLEILTLLSDKDIQGRFDLYMDLRGDSHEIYKLDNLTDLITLINKGELGGLPLKSCVLGYLETCIFSLSTTMKERMEIANTDRVENYPPEIQRIVKKFPSGRGESPFV